ncbi:type VII secretion-associated protein [Actinocrispum wychmicini]|uniref:Type VII secretion-associated protein (TIGR03931 family) n=1 Tax=Actinocrispum wychmicini TaxID=1213861 RepID=A0A4V2S8V7_9PSEU|nr:type VII secretion-associated protein [Actinocrispum wychmicini]TCO65380.1 type VII secretion-associated protein (TIGR03931 family) [Actinocrispum wychmicini]
MAVRVAVDFGTSSTCVAVSVNAGAPQVVAIDGRPVMSSAVYAATDGTLFVGVEAERQAAVDPSRFEPNPKRRIDEPELLLGNSVVPVRAVIRAVLSRAVSEARRFTAGAAVSQLVLTHPADWGGIRARVLRQAGNGLAERIFLVPEPVAAAVFHVNNPNAAVFVADPAPIPTGDTLAVLDLGGGTVDVSVVRRVSRTGPGQGFHVLATKGDPSFGGADVDQVLMQHIGQLVSNTDPDAWRALTEGRELADRRRRRVVAQDVQGAKETLSRHTFTDVPMPPPFADAHVTRVDLEQLIEGPLSRAVELTAATIRESGVSRVDAIFLVGGSSRIPMVARLVHERIGVMPVTLDQPETVVARGALIATEPAPTDSGRHTVRTPPRPVITYPVPVPPPPPPPAPPRRKARAGWLVGAGALAVVIAVTLVVVLTANSGPTPPPGRTIAQFDYQFTLPEDWKQVSSDTANREVAAKPSGAENGDDTIVVQELALDFDATAQRDRAMAALRAKYDQSTVRLADLNENATFAGRSVVSYRQRLDKATVDWFVLFVGHAQVSTGCQYTDANRDRVLSACDQVVRTMTVTA